MKSWIEVACVSEIKRDLHVLGRLVIVKAYHSRAKTFDSKGMSISL